MADRIGRILVSQGIIEQAELEYCLGIQKTNGTELIGQVLRQYDFADDDQIARALMEQAGLPLYEAPIIPDIDKVNALDLVYCEEHLCVPFDDSKGQSACALAKPGDLKTIDAIREALGEDTYFYVASEENIKRALKSCASSANKLIETSVPLPAQDLNSWIDQCLINAITAGATDIHIEPNYKALDIRYRIDGILFFMQALPLNTLPRIVNIIFHKSQVTVSDFGHMHDARFTYTYSNREIDVRVSHIPSVKGSSLVLRLLDKGKALMHLRDLGYAEHQWRLITENLLKPEGLVILAGPTGCGKSTTLYAMLNYLKSISRKIVTIEDPVEMHIPLLTQVQIQEKKGISFASAVRSFLRHDPNIILVGEIRDQETAREAIRAAMTGHKVFATVHANRPVDVLLRFNDLGVPFTHMAGNINMVIAQRLIRTLCKSCAYAQMTAAKDMPAAERKYIASEYVKLHFHRGCDLCREGYKGRTVVSEVLSVTERRDDYIASGDLSALRKTIAQDPEYITMFNDAKRLISEGRTTASEAVRILG